MPIMYGLIFGTFIIVYSIVTLWFMGDFTKLNETKFKLFEMLGYLRYLFLIVAVYLAIRQNKKDAPTEATFKMLLKNGVKVAFVIALMVGLMELVYIFLNPDFYEKYGMMYLQEMKSSGTPENEIKMAQEQMERYSVMKTPWANGLFYFFETAFIGNIASFAFAMIMRRRD